MGIKTKKDRKRTAKQKEGSDFGRLPSFYFSFFFFFGSFFVFTTHKCLCRCLWVVKAKKKETFQNRSLLFLFSSFFVFTTHKHLHTNLWVLMTKKDEKRKRRERFWKIASLFLSSFFVGFLYSLIIRNFLIQI